MLGDPEARRAILESNHSRENDIPSLDQRGGFVNNGDTVTL